MFSHRMPEPDRVHWSCRSPISSRLGRVTAYAIGLGHSMGAAS